MLNVYKLHYVSGSTNDLYVYFLVCNIPSITVNQYKEINFGDQSFTRSGELL